jgi:hypothetical protein
LLRKGKAGQHGDPSVLNRFLAASRSYPQLDWGKPRSPKLETIWQQDTPAAILAPVAQSAADLLATADFTFIKPCEAENCVLWFFDQTKVASAPLVQYGPLRQSPRGRRLQEAPPGFDIPRFKLSLYERRKHNGTVLAARVGVPREADVYHDIRVRFSRLALGWKPMRRIRCTTRISLCITPATA